MFALTNVGLIVNVLYIMWDLVIGPMPLGLFLFEVFFLIIYLVLDAYASIY